MFNGKDEIIICFLYIPSSESNWFKSGKSFNFDELKQELAFYERQDSAVFIIGDNNAWLGLENDFIVNDEIDEFMTLPEDYIPDLKEKLPKRVSCNQVFDSKGNANELINIWKSTGY